MPLLSRLLTFAASAIFVCAPASAQYNANDHAKLTPQECGLPADTKYYEKLGDIPADVLRDFKLRAGEIADLNQPYNSSDVTASDSPPQRRLKGAGLSQNTLFIWYERGGRATSFNVVGYWYNPDTPSSAKSFRRLSNSHFQGNPCGATLALIAGTMTADDRDL